MTVVVATPELLRKTLEDAGLSPQVVSAVLANATFPPEETDPRDVRNLVLSKRDGEVNVTSRRFKNPQGQLERRAQRNIKDGGRPSANQMSPKSVERSASLSSN